MLVDQPTFSVLKTAINRVGQLELPATGNSMYPFIHEGDICRFVSVEPSAIKKGEICLFCSPTGQLIAHRFYKTEQTKRGLVYIFKGDTNIGFDEPIIGEKIIGRLVCVCKKGKHIYPRSPVSFLWGKLIQTVPLLSGLLRRYLNRHVHP